MASSDVNVINIKVLKQYQSNFSSEKARFSNITYKTFSNSYINKCQDRYISSIARKLEKCYEEVADLYKIIDNWWKSYNDEATNLENVLTGNTSSGVFNEQGLREYSKCLPELKDYTVVFQDVVVNSNSNVQKDRITENSTLSTVTDSTVGQVMGITNYNQEINRLKQELDNLKIEYNNKYNYFKYNEEAHKEHLAKQKELEEKIAELENLKNAYQTERKKQIIEALGFNYLSKDEICIGYIVMTLDSVQQEIDAINSKLDALESEYNSSYSLNEIDKQELLEKQIAEYKEGKKLIEEAMADYLELSSEELNGLLDFYDTLDEETQAQLLYYPITTLIDILKQETYKDKPWWERTGATAATGCISLLEGVGQLGEGIYDTGALVSSGVKSIFTGLYDGGQAIYGAITGEEWESVTKEMWENTKEKVSKQYVTDFFNYFYDNTEVGQFLKNSSYGFDMVRSISNGIGYYGGAALLTVATGGIGGLSMGTSTAIVTTTSSVGKNTQDAWVDGANIGEGIAYGFARGVYDGIEVLIGSKIGDLKIFNSFNSSLMNQLSNSATHVVLDSLDSASGAFIDPLLQMIYNPNENNIEEILNCINYDEEGNQINNVQSWDELTFGEKYKALFKYNGGWQTVKTNAAFGAITSAVLGEVGDIAKSTQVDSIANSLSSGNKNILDSISTLDDSKLQDLVNVSSNRGIMSELVDNLDAKQLDRVVDSLTTFDMKRLVDDNNVNILIETLDDAQLRKLYDKMGDNAALKEFKQLIENKLNEIEVAKLNDKLEIENEHMRSDSTKSGLDLVNNELLYKLKNVSLIRNPKEFFVKLKDSTTNFIDKLRLKSSKSILSINNNLVDKKTVNEILKAIEENSMSDEILKKISKLNVDSLATLINNTDQFDLRKISQNLSKEQILSITNYVDNTSYIDLLNTTNLREFTDDLTSNELQSILNTFNDIPNTGTNRSAIRDILIKELYEKESLSNLKLTEYQLSQKMSSYNELLDITNSDEYLNWKSQARHDSRYSNVKANLKQLEKEINNAELTNLTDLDIEIKHKLTDAELEIKIQEYNRLIDISRTQDYQNYMDLYTSGHALVYNEEYSNLMKNLSILEKEIEYNDVVDNFIKSTEINVSLENLTKPEKISALEIIDIFKSNDSYSKLLNQSIKTKIKYGLASNQLYDMIKQNGYDLGLSNQQLLDFKNFADTYGNNDIATSVIKNGYVEVSSYKNDFDLRVEVSKISTSSLLEIISDEDRFKLFRQFHDKSDSYESIFGKNSKFKYILGFEQLGRLIDDGDISLKLTDDQINRCNILFKDFSVQKIETLKKWANTEMLDVFKEHFSSYVDTSKIEKLKNTVTILDEKSFLELEDDKYAMAFNSKYGSVLNAKYSDERLKATAIHESLHELSRTIDKSISGINVNQSYRGLNEAITEYLTKSLVKSTSGYDPAVLKLQNILDMKIPGLDENTLKIAYFTNNPIIIKDAIVNVTNEKFYDDLLKAFNDSTEEFTNTNLNRLVRKLKKKVSNLETVGNEYSHKQKIFLEQSEKNKTKLESEILDTLDPKYDEIQTIRKAYMELNKRVNYDPNYMAGDEMTQQAIFEKNVSFETLSDKYVVCSGWSELYRELLIDAGISLDRIKIFGDKHRWVEIDMGDNVIIADATESIVGAIDLSNSKTGLSTNGFMLMPKSYSGSRLSNIYKKLENSDDEVWKSQFKKGLDQHNSWLKQVDHTLGYETDSGNFNQIVTYLKETFGDSTPEYSFEEIEFIKNEFIDMEIPSNMDGIEAYSYFRKIRELIDNDEVNTNVVLKFLMNKTEKGAESILKVIVYSVDGEARYMTYSESTGKKIYSNRQELDDYINSLNLTR